MTKYLLLKVKKKYIKQYATYLIVEQQTNKWRFIAGTQLVPIYILFKWFTSKSQLEYVTGNFNLNEFPTEYHTVIGTYNTVDELISGKVFQKLLANNFELFI